MAITPYRTQEGRKKKKPRVEGESFLVAQTERSSIELLSGHDIIPQIINAKNL